MKTVYLAGPITGLSYAGATDWRKYAVHALAQAGIKGLSPMRGKEYLSHLASISGTGEEYAHLGVLSTQRAITTRDRWDCTRADVVLVNLLGAKTVSIGTIMEIAWANLARVPVVCAVEPDGGVHSHMMVWECIDFRVPTLDVALDTVKAILS